MQPILELKKLTKAYTTHGQTTLAVNNISFSVSPGEILGILGVSGSGKSTLARLITRLEDADSGTILLDGQDITALRGAPLRAIYDKVQLVFQEHTASFNPRRTIGYGVGEALLNKGMSQAEAAKRTAALLTECGLAPELAERYPSQLSGGQCQRAAIARALAHEPQLIILDEATSALDSAVQREIIGLLRRLQREKGLAYLFICHNPALVRSFCHRVAVLHRGELVELGETEQVFTQPRSTWTQELLAAVLE